MTHPHIPPAARSGYTDARKGRQQMSELVRVKLPNGDEATVGVRAAAVFGATVIEKPAVDGNGRPLAVKPNIHKGGTLSLSKSSPRPDLEKHAVEVLGMSADDVSAFANKSDLYEAIEEAIPATTNQES